MICPWPQNKLQFQRLLPHSSQIFFPGASFWDQQRASSRWGLDLESMVGGKAIRILIQKNLPSFLLTCGTVHCLDERWFFSSLCAVVFLRFHPSNAPITQCNSRCWYIFPFQGRRCKLYCAHPKKLTPWLCQLTVAFSDASDGFHRLHATQLTAASTPEWNDGSMFRKQWQTALWIVDSLLLLFHCEQTRHPFGKDLHFHHSSFAVYGPIDVKVRHVSFKG